MYIIADYEKDVQMKSTQYTSKVTSPYWGRCPLCDFEARLDSDEECHSTLFVTEAAEAAVWNDSSKAISTANCFYKKEDISSQDSKRSVHIAKGKPSDKQLRHKDVSGIRARMAGRDINVNSRSHSYSTGDRSSRIRRDRAFS